MPTLVISYGYPELCVLDSEASSRSAEKVLCCIICAERWHVTHVFSILQADSLHDGYDGGRTAALTSLPLQFRCVFLKISRAWENGVPTFDKHEGPANNQVPLLVIHDAQIKLTHSSLELKEGNQSDWSNT